jgi:hypothetical protein
MGKLYNLARMTTATVGAGTITLGSAVSGYLTFALAGAANADVVSYGIHDGANSEVGTGTYTSAGTTLTRTVTKSTNANAAIGLSGTAEVFITARAEDLPSLPVSVANGGTGDTGTAWASWTPTVTASTGTFTTTSSVCTFKTIGKTVHMRGAITITSIGTASGVLKFTLPATAVGPAVAMGVDNTALYQVWINTGNSGSTSTVAVVLTPTGSGPVGQINTNGAVFYFSGTYEST